jgi:hypothetical protein
LESERLSRGCTDHIPQIDIQIVAKSRHFVNQCDVDVSIGVFQELGHFGLARSLGFHYIVDKSAVEICRHLGAVLGVAADHLWRVSWSELIVSWIDTLRRECQVEVNACNQAGGLENRADDLIRGARVRRRLQGNQRSRLKMCGDSLDSADHRAEIRTAAF